jgi:hypothetical protein
VSRGKVSRAIAKNRTAPRLIKGDPVLALGDRLEDNPRVVLKVQGELFPVQKSTVPLVKPIGQVPVVEGDVGRDSSLEQVINKLYIVIQALLVDGVVAPTQRDDSRP